MNGDYTYDEKMYLILSETKYKRFPYETRDLGDDMSIVNQAILDYFKPRFLMDHRTRCAYEFMDANENLTTVKDKDICWDHIADLPSDSQFVARQKCFHYPSFVRQYKNGVAMVVWQLNPDGRYYMDDDGFGMTDDEEINIYGFIDRTGQVVLPFRTIKDYSELETLRKEAEGAVKSR